MNCEIEDLKITIDWAITIQVLNVPNSFFAQFLGILSNEDREKRKLSHLMVLPNSHRMNNFEWKIKRRRKQTTQNDLQKTEKPSTPFKDSEESTTGSISKLKFCKLKHKPNEYWHLHAKCYYCDKIGYIAKFCMKNYFFMLAQDK